MAGLNELLGLVKESRGPNRELDVRIEWEMSGASYADSEVSDAVEIFQSEDYGKTSVADQFGIATYTKTIDAAIALVDRLYPKVRYEVCRTGWGFNAEFWPDDNSASFMAEHHDSAPLAILAALLSALIAKEPSNDQ